jgi:hypothetical protein
MSETKEQQSSTEDVKADSQISHLSVHQVVDDWEQTYFANESWPPHVKAHISHALGQLRTRIKGLVS